MSKNRPSEMLGWARMGAQVRLRELETERGAILNAFPGLTSSAGPRVGRKPGKPTAAQKSQDTSKRKRRKMSAAARKRISDAQKKRWAAQKASKS